MRCKERLLETADLIAACARAGQALASRHLTDLMPGYTHLQPAQVTTPAHYLTALTTHLLRTLRRLRGVYADLDLSPLGAGAMTGLELDWDRERMAGLLGFSGAQPHTLVAVASRSWVLEVAAELSTCGVTLGRFVTDLMTWSGGGHGFVDLPDELAGISSAMPQKRNFPVLERIRGRAAHLTSHYLDAVLCQRATPYGNSVEVAKEGGVALAALLDDARSVFRLLALVLEHLRFDPGRMRALCEREYLGGFTLANLLTLRAGSPRARPR
ncbi:lyase family protein [Nonomuraea antimicrobica]